MTEKRLNNCLLIHVHKDITEQLDLVQIAEEFVSAKEERRRFLVPINKHFCFCDHTVSR